MQIVSLHGERERRSPLEGLRMHLNMLCRMRECSALHCSEHDRQID